VLGRTGLWSFYVYKTPLTPGDVVDRNAMVNYLTVNYQYDQSEPDFDKWQLASETPFFATAGYHVVAYTCNWYADPIQCKMYHDALRLEYLFGDSGDGGANSTVLAIGAGVQGVSVTPNPAGRTARVSYVVPQQSRVDVVVYDVMGRAVLRAAQGIQRPGVQTATISVAGLPTGTYMARVSANGVNATCRFVVCR
jgi:hypothetical protein